MYKKARQKFAEWKLNRSFQNRTKSIKKAVKHAKGHDGVVVSRAVYLRALELFAIFASQVEKSGGISPNVRRAMLSDTLVITQLFVDAAVLGDPSLQMQDVRDRYVRARSISQGKKARARMGLQQALKVLGMKREQLPKRNLSAALTQAQQKVTEEARNSLSARVAS